MDDSSMLDIPEFLKRPMPPGWVSPAAVRTRKRARKIPYPVDGFACKGMRAAARDCVRAARQRHAERCRVRR